MIEKKNNPVLEFYLMEENKNKMLSRDTLTKKLNLSRKEVNFYLENSKNIVRVRPIEVGSAKEILDVFKYTDDPENEVVPKKTGLYMSKQKIRTFNKHNKK